eukprot:TRINITY_DN2409_c0_g1_i12.p1 TRINITY_DN2409_c0_g1~~TRINITY_DN2409_c0_g1_i12.p1  ORF type:complete len:138 (-),score=53.39 TRINITY_DN2409_c0_g1_i12:336-749(-)
MTTTQSVAITRYREEVSETSSIPDEELNRILTSEIQREFKDIPEGMSFNPIDIKHLRNLPAPSEAAIGRAHRDPDYNKYMEEFARQHGKTAYDPIEIDRVGKKLDSNFKILQEHTKEVERKDCDLMLYRNVRFALTE